MTAADIRKLEAGPETDALVAVALGWPAHEAEAALWARQGYVGDLPVKMTYGPLPEYTADTPDGWAVMREEFSWLRTKRTHLSLEIINDQWVAAAWNMVDEDDYSVPAAQASSSAPTLPLAVARLVLLVAAEEEKA